jgi:N-acyl amino acid synthase of PEP-CTERM/exosortase system
MEPGSNLAVSDAEPVSHPSDRFRQYFEIVPGLDDEIRDSVYRIRHEVYCEDLHFEPAHADQREIDECDAHSVHCLLRRNDESREPVGCTRLVLAHKDGVDYEMPFERTCADVIDRSLINPRALRRHEVAEVSRLAVRRKYRQRKHESDKPISLTTDDFGTPDQPRFPHIPVGLYLGSVALAHRCGLKTLFVLTEPRMAQHFGKLGVRIRPIGAVVDHRGARLPSVMHVEEIIETLRPFLQPAWHAINAQIDTYLRQYPAAMLGPLRAYAAHDGRP